MSADKPWEDKPAPRNFQRTEEPDWMATLERLQARLETEYRAGLVTRDGLGVKLTELEDELAALDRALDAERRRGA